MKPRTTGAWLFRVVLLVGACALLGAPAAASVGAEGPAAVPFAFQWTGTPEAPQPWAPNDWDLIVHARDQRTWTQLDTLTAQHGADCSPPPATHTVSSYPDSVFICKNHMMTGFLPGGYGEIEFAPNQLADWSSDTAVISWHQSTFRTSARDWTDVVVTPFDENLILPAHTDVDLRGRPRDAIQVQMSDSIPTKFSGTLMNDFKPSDITTGGPALENVVAPSAVDRTHFQLEISRTHVRFGIPEKGVWWIDRDVPPLKFSSGVVQLGHHSYTPDKECTPTPGVLSCTGDTWHWSDFSMSSAVPFTIVRSNASQPGQHIGKDTSPVVQFPSAAPANSHLRFAAVGRISLSFDGGKTWTDARTQASEDNPGGAYVGDYFSQYWTPVPEGTSTVTFRGENAYWADWWVVDPAIWSSAQPPAGAPAAVPPAAASGPAAAAPPAQAAPAPADPEDHLAPNRVQEPASRPAVTRTDLDLVARVRSGFTARRLLLATVLLALGAAAGAVGGHWFWVHHRRSAPRQT